MRSTLCATHTCDCPRHNGHRCCRILACQTKMCKRCILSARKKHTKRPITKTCNDLPPSAPHQAFERTFTGASHPTSATQLLSSLAEPQPARVESAGPVPKEKVNKNHWHKLLPFQQSSKSVPMLQPPATHLIFRLKQNLNSTPLAVHKTNKKAMLSSC